MSAWALSRAWRASVRAVVGDGLSGRAGCSELGSKAAILVARLGQRGLGGIQSVFGLPHPLSGFGELVLGRRAELHYVLLADGSSDHRSGSLDYLSLDRDQPYPAHYAAGSVHVLDHERVGRK